MGTSSLRLVSTALLCFSLWLWLCLCITCEQPPPEDEELFSTVKQRKLGWRSYPEKAWNEIRMKLGSETENPVYQACSTKKLVKTLWSNWIPKEDGHLLFMDLTFTQEVEVTAQSPLLVYVLESDIPLQRINNEGKIPVLSLHAPRPFHPSAKIPEEIEHNLNFSQGLHLGDCLYKGFHLGFSYSGSCLFIASVRLYFRKCPGFTQSRANFVRVAGGSGLVRGSCVENSVEVSPPQRECHTDGLWGPLQGQCDCIPGHQEVRESCVACKAGTYKPTNGSGKCGPCPPNSKADGEGAENCKCMLAYSRVPEDPIQMGCTRPPSSPQKVRVYQLSGSFLSLHWDPPFDRGGREKVWYDVQCRERKEDSGDRWEPCGEAVHFYPTCHGLNGTAVNITGMDPYLDYQLLVMAVNAISTMLSRADSAESMTITRKLDNNTPVPTTIMDKPVSSLVVGGGVGGGLLLLTLLIAAICHKRHKCVNLSQDQQPALLPMQTRVTYRHPEQCNLTSAPQPVSIQLLEGLNGRLLKEMLVDHRALTLGKALGAGQFGSVYEGIFSPQEGVNIRVAVKTMKVGVHSLEDLESFLKEAEIMQNFDHDNVVKLLGVALKQEQEQDSSVPVPMVLMPFMKHGDLRRFLIATRYGDVPMFVPYQSLLRFMIDVAAGMEYLSSHSFIHRDLAARNCMLGDDLRVRVADFGLSKKIYSSNYYRQKVAVCMPVKWMAVESLSESIYSTKSDVWSFGVTMWEIVSWGRTPYPGVHNHELLDLLESGHRLKQLECDDKLYEVMLSCWSRNPMHRPDFVELGGTLKGLLSKLPPLEASQEAHYINQGLEVANQRTAEEWNPHFEEGATGNLYMPSCMALKPPLEEEDGYLLSRPNQKITDSL
ncbi:hypothetical protein AAFF_G00318510 [Aldrovandia affinis]|uniref:receptor protein-tyrosine kinase n=1 Tax=Aldrovandia affinis TaxID=143900 RepID=A0AAD7SND3_9TELE|nr:hypothetical protein AAFF_G00318510 [Aldrovandia affinis]